MINTQYRHKISKYKLKRAQTLLDCVTYSILALKKVSAKNIFSASQTGTFNFFGFSFVGPSTEKSRYYKKARHIGKTMI